MRVLFLNPIGNLGGAERSLLDLIASLRQSQPAWDLHLIVGAEGPLVSAAESLGVSVRTLPLPLNFAGLGDAAAGGPAGNRVGKAALALRLASAALSTARYIGSLRKLLRCLNPSLIHSNGFKMHILSGWAAPRRIPIVWHVHDYLSPRPVMRKLMRLHSRCCSAVIANSNSVAVDIGRILGARPPVHKLWNTVDLSEFSPEGPRLDLDNLCGLPKPEQSVIRVGLVGTFARWKGHQVFLHALAQLPETLNVRGYVVGAPLYQTGASQWSLEELTGLTNSLGLRNKVGFTGFIARPAEAMRALDIVVHASTEPEPFGLVIIEAMACGRPVIASRSGGAAEISEGDSGVLDHSPGDPANLASRIALVAGDRNLRQRLSLLGRIRAEEDFDRVAMGLVCARIYESVNGWSSQQHLTESVASTLVSTP